MADFRKVILEASQEEGLLHKETRRSLILKCPSCGKPNLYFDKSVGNYRCFSGSCGDRGLVVKLLSKIKDIDWKEAKDLIFYGKEHHKENEIKIDFNDPQGWEHEEAQSIEEELHFLSLRDPQSVDGRLYLVQNRGIPTSIAEKYGIKFSPVYNRVIFPMLDESNSLMGYQARAIGDVSKKDRMRNNDDFKKGKFFMFWNLAHNSDHIIVSEGPVDAIKFDKCGGNVAALGKELTLTQLSILSDCKAKKIYWALDDDAEDLIPEYVAAVGKENFIVRLTESSKNRILGLGKEKADFGECTFDECFEAFSLAESLSNKIMVKWE